MKVSDVVLAILFKCQVTGGEPLSSDYKKKKKIVERALGKVHWKYKKMGGVLGKILTAGKIRREE